MSDYLTGWRAGRDAAADVATRECLCWGEDCGSCTTIANAIRSLPEPPAPAPGADAELVAALESVRRMLATERDVLDDALGALRERAEYSIETRLGIVGWHLARIGTALARYKEACRDG